MKFQIHNRHNMWLAAWPQSLSLNLFWAEFGNTYYEIFTMHSKSFGNMVQWIQKKGQQINNSTVQHCSVFHKAT